MSRETFARSLHFASQNLEVADWRKVRHHWILRFEFVCIWLTLAFAAGIFTGLVLASLKN